MSLVQAVRERYGNLQDMDDIDDMNDMKYIEDMKGHFPQKRGERNRSLIDLSQTVEIRAAPS